MLLLSSFAKHHIKRGTLHIIDKKGHRHTFSGENGPEVTIQLYTKKIEKDIFLTPHLSIGEGYMDGSYTIEQGTIYDFLNICTLSLKDKDYSSFFLESLAYPFRKLQQLNTSKRSRKNVKYHYDLNRQLYELFLDPDRQYSCAYFKNQSDSLDIAQLNKKNHIAAKLLLKPGQKVLDIGSGWGGLALHIAALEDVEVTGLTLSQEQLEIATERANQMGLSHRVHFYLRDYRHEQDTYDRVVSVGMFEHVGIRYYKTFFQKIKSLLTSNGLALLHSIGRSFGPGVTNPWIRKYIFPGGYCPALSEVIPSLEQLKLYVNDVEILHPHYAQTLYHWRQNFIKHWDQAKNIYDERFCRMWEFYLAASEIAFRNLGFMVFQIQFSKSLESIPLTRDYIRDAEQQFSLQKIKIS